MADHLDAPGLTSPAMDARVDITDNYAFQQPGHPDRVVLILNVNPLAPTHADEFRPDAVYETLVDTNGDAHPDISFRYRFSRKQNGRQYARVTRAVIQGDLEDGHIHEEWERETLLDGAPVSFGTRARLARGEDGVRFFAGFRSDPFFFDLLAFLAGFKFTNPGSDFFIDKNVFGIVLEMPNRLLGSNPNVGVWTRTLVPMTMQPDHVTQADQMGRPAINTVFNHGAAKNIFNVTQPDRMRTTDNGSGITFRDSFVATLASFGTPAAVADVLLPDILTFDYSSAAGFLNGRRLQDDVIDASLNLVTSGKVTTDNVGPHHDYRNSMPYLGTPHV